MSSILLGSVIILFVLVMIISSPDEDHSIYEDEPPVFKDYREDKEPTFYHPVTGYKGTKAEMDAYIINREKKLRNE